MAFAVGDSTYSFFFFFFFFSKLQILFIYFLEASYNIVLVLP